MPLVSASKSASDCIAFPETNTGLPVSKMMRSLLYQPDGGDSLSNQKSGYMSIRLNCYVSILLI